LSLILIPQRPTLFPYTTLFRSAREECRRIRPCDSGGDASPRESQPIALEEHVAGGQQVDVVVEAAGDGLHARVPVISCAIPADSNVRCTSVKPATPTMSSSASDSGRYATDSGK